MKKLLTVLTLILFASVFLAGCGKGQEKQRYRVEIVEVVDNDHYIVSKTGYTVGGIYFLTTNNENLEVGDTVYVIVTDKYNCRLFTEYLDNVGK